MRRAHHALSPINIVTDPTTGEYKLPHHVSLTDNFYKGRQIIADKVVNAATDEAK